MDLTTVLCNAQNPDTAVRTAAEEQLKALEQQNAAQFLGLLCQELADPAKPPDSRRLAGLMLKNALSAKDDVRNKELQQRWLTVDPGMKQTMRGMVLSTLAADAHEARHTAAQALGKMAAIDLPHGTWPDLIKGLLQNVTAGKDELKQATLESLGYICEDIDPDVLRDQSNDILTAVVHGMRKEEPNNEVRLAACTALSNALEFAQRNFDSEQERNYIMQVVCEATQVQDERVRVAAYECLVKIATLHYDKLSAYMHTLFNLTVEAIKNESEQVAQQAVEFWSSICDEEIDIIADEEDDQNPPRVCQNYVRGALKFLVPLLTQTLTRQSEDPEDDEWNVASAAGACLALVANTVGDDVVPEVIPFVQMHISSQDWHYRDAATLAFGSILEGPSKEQLSTLVDQAMPVILRAMKDPSAHVKDTTAWTIGRICELHHTTIAGIMPNVITALLEGLGETPKIANNVCWAIHNLAEANDADSEENSGVLSPYFQQLVQCLLQTTEREDADEHNLRNSAYEAINFLITHSAKDQLPLMFQLMPVFMQRLEATFTMQIISANDKEAQGELQGMLCGCLQVLIQRISGANILEVADKLMMLFLQVFSNTSATVHEEALMAVGAVANSLELHFEKYVPHFFPFLKLGLQNAEDYQVCIIAVGIVGDVCRALEGKVLPFCDEFVNILLTNLQNPYLNRSVKPPILSCFGDIALAIGPEFEKYLPQVMTMLQQAATTPKPDNDDEMEEYVDALREGIFEAYTGILQGLKAVETNNKSILFLPYVDAVMRFIELVYHDENRFDSVTRTAVGVIGDMADALGPQVRSYVNVEFSKKMIRECQQSSNSSTQTIGNWAMKMVKNT